MVAEDAAGHHRADRQQDIAVHGHGHRDRDRHHDRERAPARAGAERHQRAHQEDDRRAERAAHAVAHQAGEELAGAHALDDAADRKRQHQQDHEAQHTADALHHILAKLLGGHELLLRIHHAHDQKRHSHGVQDRRGAVACGQIAAAGDQQADERATDQRDQGQHHVPLVFLALGHKLVKAVGVVEQRRHTVVIELTGGLHALLRLLHRAPVLAGQDVEEHKQQRQDAVKLERQAPHQKVHRLALDVAGGDLRCNQAHQHGAPGVQRNDRVDRGGRCVTDIGQLLARDLELVDQGPRHHAGEHDAEQTVNEDDNADHIGDEHRHALAFHALALLRQVVDEALHTARHPNKDDERAHQRREQKRFQISGVCADVKNAVDARVDRRERVPAAHDQLSHKDPEQHRKRHLPRRDRDGQRQDRNQ